MDIQALQAELNDKHPKEILKSIYATGGDIAISFSGAEDVVLVDMASKIKPGVKVFCLDTGRLHPETYVFIDKIRKYYDIDLTVLYPESGAVEKLVAKKGLFSFYEDNHLSLIHI